MVEEVKNETQENNEMLFSLSEPMHKMSHKIRPHKCEKERTQDKRVTSNRTLRMIILGI